MYKSIVPLDVVAASATWQVSKPVPEFFAKVIEAARVSVGVIAYIGDRLDKDILPARQAGTRTIFMVRGPWAYLHNSKLHENADAVVKTLTELPAVLRKLK